MGALGGRRETTGAVNHVVIRSTILVLIQGRLFTSHHLLRSLRMEKLQARLQAASTEYQKLQNDLSVAVDSRQRLDAQLQENEMVKKVRVSSRVASQ